MSDKELELTKQVLELSTKMLEDKQKERDASTKKSFYQMVVTLVVIACFGALWFYEIYQSFNYSDMTIENRATATIERREDDGKD